MARDLEAIQLNGDRFIIREGLPEELAVHQEGEDWRIFPTAPETPHVFYADYLTFEAASEKEEQIEQRGKMVLFMHGQVRDGQWIPINEELASSGITIPEIIARYEQTTGRKIDFAYVCAEEKVRGSVHVLNGKTSVFIANPNKAREPK
jgi:hypothetical protein